MSTAAPPARIVGIDLARFVAIAGMMAAHLLRPEDGEAAQVATDGYPSTLFAVIGGVSAVLATRRYTDAGAHLAAGLSLAARGVAVLALGAVLEMLPTNVYVILVYFGAALVVAALLLRLPAAPMLILAAVLAVAGPLVNTAIRGSRADDSFGDLSYASPERYLLSVLATGTYPVLTWIVYLLAGMAIAKLALRALERGERRRIGGVLMICGAATASAAILADRVFTPLVAVPELARLYGRDPAEIVDALREGGGGAPLGDGWLAILVASPHTGSTADILRSGGVGVLIIGVLVAATIARTTPLPMPVQVVQRAGAAPLTVYTAHILWTAVAITSAYALVPQPWWAGGWGILAVNISGALAIGALLRALGTRGPLETATAAVARAGGDLGLRMAGRGRATRGPDPVHGETRV